VTKKQSQEKELDDFKKRIESELEKKYMNREKDLQKFFEEQASKQDAET